MVESIPVPVNMSNLCLKTARFSSVFTNIQKRVLPKPAWGANVGLTPTQASAKHVTNTKFKIPTEHDKNLTDRHNPQAQTGRLGPLTLDLDGRRVDKTLYVDSAMAVNIRKKEPLCYFFYLRGHCYLANCPYNHAHRPLTDEEFDGLWALARSGRCTNSRGKDREGGQDCEDPMCIYGHMEITKTQVIEKSKK